MEGDVRRGRVNGGRCEWGEGEWRDRGEGEWRDRGDVIGGRVNGGRGPSF